MRYLKKFNESNFNFIKASMKKYEMFISEIDDILLDLFDSGIQYNLDRYVDDSIFEIQININSFESTDDKEVVQETILRLNDYLSQHDLHILNIEMEQSIESYSGGWETHQHDLYSIEELIEDGGLSKTAGILSITIAFGEHS
jgi:hypothetical protein